MAYVVFGLNSINKRIDIDGYFNVGGLKVLDTSELSVKDLSIKDITVNKIKVYGLSGLETFPVSDFLELNKDGVDRLYKINNHFSYLYHLPVFYNDKLLKGYSDFVWSDLLIRDYVGYRNYIINLLNFEVSILRDRIVVYGDNKLGKVGDKIDIFDLSYSDFRLFDDVIFDNDISFKLSDSMVRYANSVYLGFDKCYISDTHIVPNDIELLVIDVSCRYAQTIVIPPNVKNIRIINFTFLHSLITFCVSNSERDRIVKIIESDFHKQLGYLDENRIRIEIY